MQKSKIEHLICDKNFSYFKPYFYNNQFALRCELGIGAGNQYITNAKKRATEIYDILFPNGADAIIFNYWIIDYSDCGRAEKDELEKQGLNIAELIHSRIKTEVEQLQFLSAMQAEYRHFSVRDLETYDDCDDEYFGKVRRNRVVCYRDDKVFDYNTLIDQEINGPGYEVGFVSFQNDCILSIYDDRGCDIVFATQEKFKEFYHLLEPYFLSHDAEEMKKRFYQ